MTDFQEEYKPTSPGQASVFQKDGRTFGSLGFVEVGILTTFFLGDQEYGITVETENTSGVEDQLEAWVLGYV